MSFTSSYVMAGIGTFFILFWLFLYIKYRNAYDQVIDAIDKKKFMFGEIYFIGFGFITLFHINIKTERGSKKIKEISEIYGRKYAEFYHYVITGGSYRNSVNISLKAIVYMETAHSFLLRAVSI